MGSSRFEILVNILGQQQQLDTFEASPITLTYNIADIYSIQENHGGYSKTITLPETRNNRKIFEQVADLTSDSLFDPNNRTQCWVLVDSVQVITGYLQLNKITPNLTTGKTTYDVTIFDNNVNFMALVGESYLQDLNFNDLGHTYSYTSISDSWTKNYGNGYYYGLIDYGNSWNLNMINGNGITPSLTSLQINNFYPATYVKTIWDRIFRSVGYSYKSNFLNSSRFTNLLIPFSQIEIGLTNNLSQELTFAVGVSQSTQIVIGPTATYTGYSYKDMGVASLIFNNPDIPFPNGNINGLWDVSTSIYTNTTTNYYNQRFGLNLEFGFTIPPALVPGGGTTFSMDRDFNIEVFVFRSKFSDGVDNPLFLVNDPIVFTGFIGVIPFPGDVPYYGNYSYDLITDSPGNPNSSGKISEGYSISEVSPYLGGYIATASFLIYTDSLDNRPSFGSNYYNPLYPGEKVRFAIRKTIPKPNGPWNGWTQSFIGSGSYAFNEVDSHAVPGQFIDYNNVLPKNIKQKDFLTSIFKMFNLYVEPSKTLNNTLIVEPRDDYYALGTQLDWSRKVDILQDISEQILAETQNKTTLFTYQKDTDYYNTDYLSKTGNQLYGQLKFEVLNDFLTGEKKIDALFSPTPLNLLKGSQEIVLPILFKVNNNTVQPVSGNIRILQKNPEGLLPLSFGSYLKFNDIFGATGSKSLTMSSYPYIGHFDNPYTPTTDLNWGQSYLYYSNTPTNNNLFYTYWLNQMDELSDKNSRIITCQMYLSPNDIQQFYFNNLIYLLIDTSPNLYRVNSITDYDPVNPDQTCTVELIKVIDRT